MSRALEEGGSKPTVWDGDFLMETLFMLPPPCSEPTVWGGDVCNNLLRWKSLAGSKPTVWDGDRNRTHALP